MTRHGRSALKMVVTPCTLPIRMGLRMHKNPTTHVIARVRTADTIDPGSSQQDATLVAAQATVATVVWRPTRYKPADEKSMNGSSCDRYTSSEMLLSDLVMTLGLCLAINFASRDLV
jgi:hypothetical protein